MFFKIYVNENAIGVFGHENVLNFNAGISSVQDKEGKQSLFIKPSCVCMENGRQYFIDWPFYYPELDANIRMVQTLETGISKPERKYEMQKP